MSGKPAPLTPPAPTPAVSMKAHINQRFATHLPIVVPNAMNNGGLTGGRTICPPVPIDRLVHHRSVLFASVFDLTSRAGTPLSPVVWPIFQWCARTGAMPFILAVGTWEQWNAMLQSVTVGRKPPECLLGFPTPKLVDYLEIGLPRRNDTDPVRHALFLMQQGTVRKIWRASRDDPFEPHNLLALS